MSASSYETQRIPTYSTREVVSKILASSDPDELVVLSKLLGQEEYLYTPEHNAGIKYVLKAKIFTMKLGIGAL